MAKHTRTMGATAYLCLILLATAQNGSSLTTEQPITTARVTTYTTTTAQPTTTTTEPATTINVNTEEETTTTTATTTTISTTTATTTTTTTTTATTTTTTTTPDTPVCNNGGIFDGVKCLCPENFFGPLCELVSDNIVVGPVEVEVSVTLNIVNQVFVPEYTNASSAQFKEFERHFKAEMGALHSNIPGYKHVVITHLRAGSVIVDHHVVVEMKYPSNTSEYDIIFQAVEENLRKATQSNCSSGDVPFCYDDHYGIERIEPPELSEICKQLAPEGLQEYFYPVSISDKLTCVSACNALSPRYMNCNHGTCQLLRTGPECFCSRTDHYIYTQKWCRGRIPKLAVFIGAPVAVGVLLIIAITLGVIVCKLKQKQKPPKNDSYYTYID